MSCRNARFRPPRNRDGDNHELPLVRLGRIRRCCVDHSCVSAPTTGETPKLVAKVFTTKRGRRTADNGVAHLRLQFVSVCRGGVLVFDQLARFRAFTQYQKTFETWPAIATMNLRETTSRAADVRVVAGLMWDHLDRIPTDVRDRQRLRRSRGRARSQDSSVAAPSAARG